MKQLWFDLDGTISDFYGVPNWLTFLENADPYPYLAAKPLLNFSVFARLLNQLQRQGWHIGIISWTSKTGTAEYNREVAIAKKQWLTQHLPSVTWDSIKIVAYGTNKYKECGGGILFDDEKNNRNNWQDTSYKPEQILSVLKTLLK